MTDRRTIGFIGLGVMGKPMAGNLLEAGYPLVVHNRSRGPVDNLADRGATPASSPAEVAQKSDLIITCLPDSPDVRLVALGDEGLIEGVAAGDIHVDMSTISPTVAVEVADALAAKDVRCLDAPISGGDVGAQEGTLSIMVGGHADVFESVKAVLEVMGETIVHCGPNGAGQTVKACNQVQVALNLIGMAEALVLGEKAGVDLAVVVDVLSGVRPVPRYGRARAERDPRHLRARVQEQAALQGLEHHPGDGAGLRGLATGRGAGPRALWRHAGPGVGRPGSLRRDPRHRAPLRRRGPH